MGKPIFLLQIVEADNSDVIARVPGGGPLEADLVETIVTCVLARGVSFKTQAHVRKDLTDGIRDAIMGLKAQTKFLVFP